MQVVYDSPIITVIFMLAFTACVCNIISVLKSKK